MNKKSIYAILAAIVALALVVLLIRVVSGAFSLLSGAVNAVLGVAVILALVPDGLPGIVEDYPVWLFMPQNLKQRALMHSSDLAAVLFRRNGICHSDR